MVANQDISRKESSNKLANEKVDEIFPTVE